MKHILKKVTLFVTMLALALGILTMNTQTVSAASKPAMKKAKVKWDLKNNKTVTYKSKYYGIGMKKQKAKVTNLKVKNSKTKPGYKECTFTVKYTRRWNMTSSEVHKCANAGAGVAGGVTSIHVVDYDSGKSLFGTNTKDVTVQFMKGWTYSNYTTYRDEDNCWVKLSDATIKVKVIYPKNYKGLCVGISGTTKYSKSSNDNKYSNGNASFNKANYYFSKKDKSVAHFMRIK